MLVPHAHIITHLLLSVVLFPFLSVTHLPYMDDKLFVLFRDHTGYHLIAGLTGGTWVYLNVHDCLIPGNYHTCSYVQ